MLPSLCPPIISFVTLLDMGTIPVGNPDPAASSYAVSPTGRSGVLASPGEEDGHRPSP